MAASATMLTNAAALDITLPAAGTLKDYITPQQQETVTKLKVSGDINGDDLRIIRHMIGAKLSSDDNGKYPEVDSGACRVLDLSEANIIGEGFYTFKYVPKPSEGPAYYLPGLEVEANTITYAMFCGSKVETLILPNSVTYIGCTHRGTTTADHCIDGSHLKSVTLSEKLEHMEVYGTGMVLRHRDEGPDYYEEVPQQNLLDSPNLSEVKIAESNPNFRLIDGVLYSGDLTELMLCPPKREGKLDIPAETTKIGYCACAGTHITNPSISIGVRNVADEAFADAKFEGDLAIQTSVASIGQAAFKGFSTKGSLLIEKGNESIGQLAFASASVGGNLEINRPMPQTAFQNASVNGDLSITASSVRLKQDAMTNAHIYGSAVISCPKIEENAFDGSTIEGDLTLTEDIKTLSQEAFSQCAVRGDLTIGCEIGIKAFERLRLGGNLIVTESVKSIPAEAFINFSSAKSVSLNVDEIAERAFYGATIGGDLTVGGVVGASAFADATVKGKLIFDEGLSSIGEKAFQNLQGNDYELILPSSLTQIGEFAFNSANTVGTLVVPESVVSIGGGAFHNNNFTEIKLNGSTQYGYSGEIYQNGGLLDDGSRTSNGHLDLKVTANNAYGVFSCSNELQSIDIPKDMTAIPAFIFRDSPLLAAINIPHDSQLKEIGRGAFWGCTGLETLKLPKLSNRIKLYAYAFWLPDIKNRQRTVHFSPQDIEPWGFKDFSDYFTAQDIIYLYISPTDVESCPAFLSHWKDYGEDYAQIDSDIGPKQDFPPERYNESFDSSEDYVWYTIDIKGKIYIPVGTKQPLLNYLRSKIESQYFSLWRVELKHYPLLLYIPYDNWIEIDMPEYPADSQESISIGDANPKEIARYDINGRLLNKPVQGINIVRYSDGTVKKEFVK